MTPDYTAQFKHHGHDLTPAEVDEVQHSLAVRFPKPYRDFLSMHNGGVPPGWHYCFTGTHGGVWEDGIDLFLGVDTKRNYSTLAEVNERVARFLPDDAFVFALANAGHLIIRTATPYRGWVFMWEPDRGKLFHDGPRQNCYVVAKSFSAFLKGISLG